MKSWIRKHIYTILTLLGMVSGIGFGFLLLNLELEPVTIDIITLPGTLFIRSIYLLIAPLVLTSIISGIAESKVEFLNKLKWFLPLYCLSTSLLAAITGVTFNFITPAVVPPSTVANYAEKNDTGISSTVFVVSDPRDVILDVLRNIFPNNLVKMFFEIQKTETIEVQGPSNSSTTVRHHVFVDSTNMCGIICFSVFFGIVLLKSGEKTSPIKSVITSTNFAIMEMIRIIMITLPAAIVFLIAGSIARATVDLSVMAKIVLVTVAIVAGIVTHITVTLSLVYYAFIRKNPYVFMMKMKDALVTAWSTMSSAVTLPTTIRCFEKHHGSTSNMARVMLPITATINMDGGALVVTQAVLFMAKEADVILTIDKIFVIVLVSLMVSISLAAIPGALLVALVTASSAANVPGDLAVFFIALEFIIDRFSTSCNIYGDTIGVAIASKLFASVVEKDEETQKSCSDIEEGKSSLLRIAA